MIQPTVGRIVHYFFAAGAVEHAAILVGVHNERSINLAVFNDDGSLYPALEVPLLQDDDAVPAEGAYAAWMPFQKGQATKTEATESGLGARVDAIEKDLVAKLEQLGNWTVDQVKALHERVGAPTPPEPAPAAAPAAPAAEAAEAAEAAAEQQPEAEAKPAPAAPEAAAQGQS